MFKQFKIEYFYYEFLSSPTSNPRSRLPTGAKHLQWPSAYKDRLGTILRTILLLYKGNNLNELFDHLEPTAEKDSHDLYKKQTQHDTKLLTEDQRHKLLLAQKKVQSVLESFRSTSMWSLCKC